MRTGSHFFRRGVHYLLGAAALPLSISSTTWASAAFVTPTYVQNFDGTAPGSTLPVEYTQNNTATVGGNGSASIVNVSTGNNALQQAVSLTSGGASDSLSTGVQVFPGSIPAATGVRFALSSTLNLTSVGALSGEDTSLNALSASVNFSSANGYKLDFIASGASAGQLSITENGASSGFTATPVVGTVPVSTGSTYTFTLSGTYSTATSIALTGSITDGINTSTITATDTSAETGGFFGFNTASSGANGTNLTARYDNVSLTPEPASIGVMGLAACGLLAARRRRR